jgi:hypothetical protein
VHYSSDIELLYPLILTLNSQDGPVLLFFGELPFVHKFLLDMLLVILGVTLPVVKERSN